MVTYGDGGGGGGQNNAENAVIRLLFAPVDFEDTRVFV